MLGLVEPEGAERGPVTKVAITGSSGLIGGNLAVELEADGYDVLPVVRGNRDDPRTLWDPASSWIRPGALEGVDAVVHLAGASIGEGRWSQARRETIRSSRVDATRLLVEHLAQLSVAPALVLASAVGYYGDRGDAELTEDSLPGSGFLATLVQDWEAEAVRAGESGSAVAVLRAGVVLTTRGGALPRMLTPFRFGVGGPLGSGTQWVPWVSLDDAVSAIRFAIDSRLDGVYNLVSPGILRNRDFGKALGAALHRPAFLPAPAFALRLAFGDTADEMLLASQRVSSAKIEAAGFRFRHSDLASALPGILADKR
jgi:uncharacterized protein (TIGR01777 family)